LGPLLERIQAETDCALLVIEHDMPLITGLSDQIIALDLGAVVLQDEPDAVISDPRVVNSYLGGDASVIQRSGATGTPTTKAPARKTGARRAVVRKAMPKRAVAERVTAERAVTKKTVAKKPAAARRSAAGKAVAEAPAADAPGTIEE